MKNVLLSLTILLCIHSGIAFGEAAIGARVALAVPDTSGCSDDDYVSQMKIGPDLGLNCAYLVTDHLYLDAGPAYCRHSISTGEAPVLSAISFMGGGGAQWALWPGLRAGIELNAGYNKYTYRSLSVLKDSGWGLEAIAFLDREILGSQATVGPYAGYRAFFLDGGESFFNAFTIGFKMAVLL